MEEKYAETPLWIKPAFEIIRVNLECTAYAGALNVEDQA